MFAPCTLQFHADNELLKITVDKHERYIAILAEREFQLKFRPICIELQATMVREIDPDGSTLTHLLEKRKNKTLSKKGFAKYNEYQKDLGGSIADVKHVLVSGIDVRDEHAHAGEPGFPPIKVKELDAIMASFPVDELSRNIVETAKKHCPQMFQSSKDVPVVERTDEFDIDGERI